MIRVLDSAGSTLVEWGRQQQQHVPVSVREDMMNYMIYPYIYICVLLCLCHVRFIVLTITSISVMPLEFRCAVRDMRTVGAHFQLNLEQMKSTRHIMEKT